jgi:MtN3 and saliva related transmembrane protein
MKFDIMDPNVSLTMNVFIIIANIINIIYNVPQMVKTYKTKSTKDFSETFLIMRIVGNSIWLGYSVEVDSFPMLFSNLVTIIATVFIGYYKVLEIIRERRYVKVNNQQEVNVEMNIDETL